jgi:uncharacterized protein YbaR (Trm112 family)
MKKFGRILGLLLLVGVAVVIVRAIRQYRQDSVFDLSPASGTGGGAPGSGQKRKISPELLEILADPADKGPVELVVMEGKEWLVNRRNGYRYPVEDGIPIMLIEEGEKYKDENLIKQDNA